MKPINQDDIEAFTRHLSTSARLIESLNEALKKQIKLDRKNKLEVLFAHTDLNCVPDDILDAIYFRANGSELFVYFDLEQIKVTTHRVKISNFSKFLTDNNISWENMF